MSRASAEINLSAISKNLNFIKSQTKAQVLAVVKADAYGHGLIEVAQQVVAAGADWIGTALLEEGIRLRKSGISTPIISWMTPIGEDFKNAIELDIDLSISSPEFGMNRGGFGDEWSAFLPLLAKSVADKEINLIGVWSHFARADEPAEKMNQDQLVEFEKRVEDLKKNGIDFQYCHIANSAASLKHSQAHKNIIRWGIGLYGLSPDVNNLGSSKDLGLIPAMKLKAKLQLVKSVKAGVGVGYGSTATTKSDTKLGVVAMGYADGIPRNTNQSAGVFVDGKRAPIIGRVSMDQFVVDLGASSNAKTGDEVIVFGDGSGGEYTVDEWAKASGTINYEIVTRIGPRVPRIYSRE